MRASPFAAVLALVSLAACAHGFDDLPPRPSSQQAADARVRQWIGHDVQEVIRAWGPPTIALRDGTAKTYKWRWGKPERFSNRREDSQGAWADRTARWTAVGSLIAKDAGWMAECRESFDVDSWGQVVAAHTDGECPPVQTMILEGSASGSDGLGVGEL